MAHIRQQIREAAVTVLTGATAAGSRVYKSSRTDPFPADELPGIRVSVPNEESGVQNKGSPALLGREIVLRVAAWDAAGDDIDDLLDDLAEDIEVAVAVSARFGGLALEVTLSSTEVEITGEGANRAGVIVLDFGVVAATLESDPATAV